MGKGAEECRTETERGQHAEKENDVSRRPEEDCRSTASAMGESEGGSEEDCVVGRLHKGSQGELKPFGVKPRALLVGKPKPDVSARDRRRVSLVAEAKRKWCA